MTMEPAVTAVSADLAEFCHGQHRRVVGLLSLYVGERDVAEELAQDVFVKVIANWGDVADMERPEAWVTRVAINSANSWGRRRTIGFRAHSRDQARRPPSVSDPDPADAVAVRRAVAALPRRQRTAIVLRYYLDLSVAEVAAEMGCTDGTVKRLTSDAIHNLRANGLDVSDD